jgi:hypothetical protein
MGCCLLPIPADTVKAESIEINPRKRVYQKLIKEIDCFWVLFQYIIDNENFSGSQEIGP